MVMGICTCNAELSFVLNKNNRNVEPGARIKNWFTPRTGLYWLQSRGIDLYVFLGR